MTLRIIDLCCGVGGASKGYADAGFTVSGIDHKPQPNYPYEFQQISLEDLTPEYVQSFDMAHASPPCQLFTPGAKQRGPESLARHTNYIPRVRELVGDMPYIIENVPGAPLIDPVMLCGSMFGLTVTTDFGEPAGLKRHRLFESNMPLEGAGLCTCRDMKSGSIYGKCGDWDHWGQWNDSLKLGFYNSMFIMGIGWAQNYTELAQAIPPVYTEWLGRQAMTYLLTGELKSVS